MIPHRLTLRNFMSYGEDGATLLFDGIHVACISGDNGNGKSALLDAITWVLWGKTRASGSRAVSEDDLIRLGADSMEVEFEFDLNERRYRVQRKRKRGKSGSSEWHISQRCNGDQWMEAGGPNQRETGREIVRILSMEYETFVNSAYLQQGRADEFTRQTPDNRKRILGEILGLDRYDRLEAMARERQREMKEASDELSGRLRMLESEVGKLEDLEAGLARATEELTAASAAVAGHEQRVTELRGRRAALDQTARSVAEAELSLKRLDADFSLRQKERDEQQNKVTALQQVLAQRDAVLKDYGALQEARLLREKLEPEVEAYNKAIVDLRALEGAMEVERTRLKGQLELKRAGLESARKSQTEMEQLAAMVAASAAEISAGSALEPELTAAQAEREAAQSAFSNLSARHKQLETDIADLDEVLAALQGPRSTCPICDSDLSGARRDAVIGRQNAKRAGAVRLRDELRREGVAARKVRDAVDARLKDLQDRQDALTAARARHAELARHMEALRAELPAVATLAAEVESIECSLKNDAFAAPRVIHKQRLTHEIERLARVKAEAETVSARIRSHEPTEARFQRLKAAEQSIEAETADLAAVDAHLQEMRSRLAAMRTEIERLRGELTGYDELVRELGPAEKRLGELRAAEGAARVTEARHRDDITRCKQAMKELAATRSRHRDADEQRKQYQALAAAFGRRGVQALIIENAIPEIEEEANLLLGRMTEQAMQIRFETTRAAKTTGAELETLDIRITDDAGTRPYELYSGGEAFRVNFAVRIALSRLLARRSGARLQTLIMDEGFGSQDGKGRDKLVEVIETIKSDFEKILVITHFEELKDAFNQRIEVVKGTQGSQIHLL